MEPSCAETGIRLSLSVKKGLVLLPPNYIDRRGTFGNNSRISGFSIMYPCVPVVTELMRTIKIARHNGIVSSLYTAMEVIRLRILY